MEKGKITQQSEWNDMEHEAQVRRAWLDEFMREAEREDRLADGIAAGVFLLLLLFMLLIWLEAF